MINALLTPQHHQKAWSKGLGLSLKAKAWGVNFRNVLQALCRLGEMAFGYECAAVVVTRVGSGGLPFRPGDNVCIVFPGRMRKYPRAPATSVVKIHNDTTFTTVTSVLVPG